MALFHYLCFTRKISIPFSSVISQHRCHAGSGTEGNILTCSVPAAASSPRIPMEHPGTVLHSSTMGRVLCLPPYFPYKPTRQEITGLLELFERSWFFTKWKIKGQQHEPGLLLAMGAAGVYRTKEKQRVITAKPALPHAVAHTAFNRFLPRSVLWLFQAFLKTIKFFPEQQYLLFLIWKIYVFWNLLNHSFPTRIKKRKIHIEQKWEKITPQIQLISFKSVSPIQNSVFQRAWFIAGMEASTPF